MLGNCKATYNKLTGQRNVYLDRARAFASVTIPSILLEEGHLVVPLLMFQ